MLVLEGNTRRIWWHDKYEEACHRCWSLKQITEGFGGMTSLKKLHMWECEALEEFHVGLSKLLALKAFGSISYSSSHRKFLCTSKNITLTG